MSKFAIRCTIHNGSWQDYENLHAGLANIRCFRTVVADNGQRYALPEATYVCDSAAAIGQLRDAVMQVARRVSPTKEAPQVIIFRWDIAAWSLKPAPATPAALGLPAYR